MRRSDVTWLVVGGVIGVAVVLVGLALLGGETSAIGLLLPLAVLGGGLLWAADGAQTGSEPAPVSPADPSVRSAPPVVVSAPDAVDAPTIVASAAADDEGDAESVSEAVRVDAARTFDLDRFLVDDRPDRIQCAECGRYSALVPEADRRVRCGDCGASRPLSEVQPDTLVRTFVVTGGADVAGADSGDPSEPAGSPPPNRSQGG